MQNLDYIFSSIFDNGGVLTGSYVRDCVIRQEPECKERGIDVLVPFGKVRRLVSSLKKLGGQVEEVDYDEQDRVARYVVMVDEWLIDISCEYFYPPDVDVSALSWTYRGLSLWYKLAEDWSYGHSMDVQYIVRRCRNHEAVVLVDEWEDKEMLNRRLLKLIMKGWTLY